jgi:small subunit ribosomal protein S2
MAEVGMKELLQAGVHFGHQTHRWNPKMRKYIFAQRSGIYLIDLKKTLQELERAKALVRETILAGKTVLFVCTKPQLAPVVRSEAERGGSVYVTERWLGGMLTNFQTIKTSILRLKELERGADEGAFEFYTKKEQLLLERERLKLERYLSGIKEMTKLPGLVYIVDSKKEEIAVKEANRLGIPAVAIADTNADPDLLTIPIAGNDDAIRSVSLIAREIADTVHAAMAEVPAELRAAAAAASASAAKACSSAKIASNPSPETTRAPTPLESRDRGKITRISTHRSAGTSRAARLGETPSSPREVEPSTSTGWPQTSTSPEAASPGSTIRAVSRSSPTAH